MKDDVSTARKISLISTSELVVEPQDDGSLSAKRRFALLIFCDAEAQLQPLTEEAATVVGREPPSEVVVNDSSISSQHARFVLHQDEVWIEDLDSRNGTFVRGTRIERQQLGVGDEVSIGRARIVLAATSTTEHVAAESATGPATGEVIQNVKMRRLYDDAQRAAQADVPALVLGETGAGKELLVGAIHRASPRRHKPFVVVNCAAIPAGLLESTLFGHERGAFTGATARAIGMFERASGGVLFLDEVGELTSSAQAALLRAIETKRIVRVGASTETPVDVRIVAATHCDLEAMVEERTFRQDLYFRLSGVVLKVPPLRERPDEIKPLVELFLARARVEWAGVRAKQVDPEAMQALARYKWPGNVRQLRHAVERAALLSARETILVNDLPDYVFQSGSVLPRAAPLSAVDWELGLRQQLQRYERTLIDEALSRAGGNRQVAAKLLRISMRTLFRRMRACGLGGTQASET